MQFKKLIAAAALAVAGVAGSATAASAAPISAAAASALTISVTSSAQDWRHRGDHRIDRNRHSGWDRGRYNRQRNYNRHRHYNRGRHHRVCRTEWRHHQRVRVCYYRR